MVIFSLPLLGVHRLCVIVSRAARCYEHVLFFRLPVLVEGIFCLCVVGVVFWCSMSWFLLLPVQLFLMCTAVWTYWCDSVCRSGVSDGPLGLLRGLCAGRYWEFVCGS